MCGKLAYWLYWLRRWLSGNYGQGIDLQHARTRDEDIT